MGRISDLVQNGGLSESRENMMKYIPGGIHKCLVDDGFTISNMSESFTALFGYTEEELASGFHSQFIGLVCPEDRDMLKRMVREQLERGDTIELEYRIRRKDGQILWILDRSRRVTEEDGQEVLYGMLLDITAQRREKEQLRLSLERHHVIMDQATDIIFEWDLKRDTVVFSPNWQKKFGYRPITDRFTKRMPDSQNICPADLENFINLAESMRKGTPYKEVECRIRNSQDEYIFCRIRATAQYGSNGEPVKAIGVITDISKEKRRRQELVERAKRDSLTGLLHKDAAAKVINNYLGHSEIPQGVLLLLDLDDFKQVNDHYGHLCGDALLTDMAGALRRVFRASDVISRVGGDEFLVFLPQITIQQMEMRVAQLQKELSEINVAETGRVLSCSVGASCAPIHAQDFNSLYKCADMALYHVKNSHKGQISVYKKQMALESFSDEGDRTAVGQTIDSEIGNAGEILGQYCFRVLYEASDIETAVRYLLEIIGRSYNVSRAYVYEAGEAGEQGGITFEWCGPGIASGKGISHDLDFSKSQEDYCRYFNEDGVFYCNDIDKLDAGLRDRLHERKVLSLLQIAICDGGVYRGYMGFDECKKNRHWTNAQITSLTLAFGVMGTFIRKYRLEEKIARLEAPEK